MLRRHFIGAISAAPAFQARRFDLLIKNGTVHDPGRGFHGKADVAIGADRIAAVEESIPPSAAADVIEARGLHVVPGLVDLHTHCYHSATALSIEAGPIAARSGATTWVDAGSFGVDQLPGFRRFIVEPSPVRIFGYVYLYPSSRNPDVEPLKYVRSTMRRTGEAAVANKDIILGIKAQIGSNMNGRYSLELLKIARELCDTFKLPLMTHISVAPPSADEVMELMRPGDIVTHCLNGHTLGIVDERGKVRPSVRDARTRGVLFDVGHGAGSFNFPAARKVIGEGFLPDAISTDIYNLNVNGPVYDMPTTMSKMMYLGLSFEDVIARSTLRPARIINRIDGLGTLAPGASADVALLALEEGEFPLVDSQRNTVMAKQRIFSRGTICRGKRLST